MTFSELSGVTIVIFIAVGALILMLLFIFAKRQIMRFALRSRRGQLPVGHGAPRVGLRNNFVTIFNYGGSPGHIILVVLLLHPGQR